MFGGRPEGAFGHAPAPERSWHLCIIAFSDGKPVSTPTSRGLRAGRLFLIMLQAQANAVANRIFIPVEIALMDTDNREPKS
jgi:hypothetical protein